MARLPIPGKDNGTWGDVLNEYLSQSHKADGTLKDNAVTSNVLAPNSVSTSAIANNAVNASSIADGSITEVLLDGSVQTKLNQAAPTWNSINGRPAVVAAGNSQADAQAALGGSETGRAVFTGSPNEGRGALDSAHKRRARTALSESTIKGGNITVKPSGNSWGGLWSEWDWNNWIKPQVDRAIVLGLNTIRVIGAPNIVLNPASLPAQITQQAYDNRWRQLADYCNEQGLRLYPCLTEMWAFTGYTGAPNDFQDPDVTECITTTAAVLAEFQNVIGFDVFQEGSGYLDGLDLEDILALYAAIRLVAPGVPLTTSNSSGNFGSAAQFWNDATSLPYQAWMADGGADFVDLHIYLEGATAVDVDSLIERVGLPVLIGEYGADQNLSSGSRVARYRSGRAVHNRPGVLGSLVWALADQGSTDANKAGVWDNTGFSQGVSPLSTVSGRRSELVNELHRFVAAPVPAQTQTQQPNLIPATASRPVGSTTGWQAGANSYMFTDPKGLGVGATAAGNVSVNPSQRVPVSPGPNTAYRVDVEVLNQVAGRTISMDVAWYDANNTYLTTSTAVTGTSGASTNAPARLSGVFTPHSSAASASFAVRMTGAGLNEWMIILASPRPRFAAM